MRRGAANDDMPDGVSSNPQTENVVGQKIAEPAENVGDILQKWRFLLDRYSTTPDASDDHIQALIRRALSDLELLIARDKEQI